MTKLAGLPDRAGVVVHATDTISRERGFRPAAPIEVMEDALALVMAERAPLAHPLDGWVATRS